MACRIMILAEHEDGAVKEISFELLGLAHRLAGQAGWKADTDIKALLLGQGADELAKRLVERGAGEVIYAEGETVAHYTGDGYRRVGGGGIRGGTPGRGPLGP